MARGKLRLESQNLSRRHHYIPRFYLNGFCNEDNEFFVFDKKQWRLKNRAFSTKTHFFDWDRNTIDLFGEKRVDLEKMYEVQDSKMSEVFRLILKDNESYDLLGVEGMVRIKFFLANLFWRIPATDQYVDPFFAKITYKDLPFSLNGLDPADEVALKKFLMEDPGFRKIARHFILPAMTFDFIDRPDFMSKWKFGDTSGDVGWNKHLTSDNPVVFANTDTFFSLSDNILFPLSGSKTIFCINGIRNDLEIRPEDAVQFDLAVFSNATRYVCSSDRTYLEEISKLYLIAHTRLGKGTHKYLIEKTFQIFH